MKVYTVQREDGITVFSTPEKAIRDIIYKDVEVEINGELKRVSGNFSEADLAERLKTRANIRFEFEGRDIWLEKQEVR